MKSFQLFAISLLLIYSQSLFSQHNHGQEEGIFSFAFNENGAQSTFKLRGNQHNYKYQTTKKVMDALIEAKGVRSMAIPKLVMSNAKRNIAWAKPSKALIGLELKAYDICISFGKDSLNALAALLAHELTHYYEKHDWKNQFAKDFGSVDNTGNRAAEKLDVETQADYLGGFLAFTAGYNTLAMMPQILDKVYAGYGFSENLPGYPSLAERKKMATKSLEKLADLIPIFETANFLIAAKDYKSAKAYYEYILINEKYQSREIYNNLGVLSTHLAMDLFAEGDLQYIYPVELDVRSRLSPNMKGMGNDPEQERKMLLEEAIKYFKNAQNLDQNYAPAMLNLGCAYALQANFFDAQYHAQKAMQMGEQQRNTKLISDAQILLGIIEARQGQKNKAANLFQKAMQAKNSLGQFNLNILQEQPTPFPTTPNTAFAKPEKIDNVSLDEMVNQLNMGSLTPTKQVNVTKKVLFALKEENNSKVLINFLPTADAYHFFHLTNDNYSGQTNKGIKIKDSIDKVMSTEMYGAPQRVVNLSNGQLLIYKRFKMFFQIDAANKVKGWAVFREKLRE